jgi:HEAT repeat protein
MIVTISRISKWGQTRNITKLIDALQTDDAELRKAVCLCLGEIKTADALLALRYIEKTDSDPFVRLTAFKTIEYMLNTADEIDYVQKQSIQERVRLALLPISS